MKKLLLCITALLLLLPVVCAAESPAEPQPAVIVDDADSAPPSAGTVRIIGISTIYLPSGVLEADLSLANPTENGGRYYLVYSCVIKETQEEVFTTGLIPPGMHCNQVTLNRELTPGEYPCSLYVQPYTMGADLTPVNNACIDVKLIVY